MEIKYELLNAVESNFNELIELFQSIIKIDTSNPPGNEVKLAEHLYNVLSREGINCEIIESSPNRGNIIAKINGESNKRLMYLSHLDVVPAQNPELWKYPPFSGYIEGNWIYGRGAIDCKSMVASMLYSLIILKRLNIKPKFTLIFASTADEEMGGRVGLGWLIEHYPEKVKAEYVINEGGGLPLKLKEKHLVYLVDVAEKGACWIKVKFKGRSGHASIPQFKDNALIRLGEAIIRISKFRVPPYYVEAVKILIEELLILQLGFKGKLISKLIMSPIGELILSRMEKNQPEFTSFLKAITRMTMTPTIVKGGVKENVIPSECELTIDCRILPGQDEKYVIKMINKVLSGISGYEVHIKTCSQASSSPINKFFLNSIESTMKTIIPNYNVKLAPYILPASSDSRYLRRLGAIVYGFAPLNPEIDYREIMGLAHGVNERIDIESLKVMCKFFTLLPCKIGA